jgi:hypothetical protein
MAFGTEGSCADKKHFLSFNKFFVVWLNGIEVFAHNNPE